MARTKTIRYSFAPGGGNANVTQNTESTLTKTLYFPETGKVFRSAYIECHASPGNAAAGNISARRSRFQIGSNTAVDTNNTNQVVNAGEHFHIAYTQNVVSQFTSFWGASLASISCTAGMQLNVPNVVATANNYHNPNMEVVVTYDYDEASSTQIKTVMIPLDANTGNLNLSSNTTYGTFPNLDTYLPEASKVYRDIYVVVQGNLGGGGTTDSNVHILVGATAYTSSKHENALASDRNFKLIFPIFDAGFNGAGFTDTEHNFQLGAAGVTRYAHVQAWAVVTYEYDEASTTRVMNSLMLPMEMESPSGRLSTAYQRATREVWIQEPGTITTERVAYYLRWNQSANMTGFNMRIGTGSFVQYDDYASILCGDNMAMIRNDTAFTLARGRNELNFDVYRTDTADFMWNVSGFWLINYTSDKSGRGTGAHNHTIELLLDPTGTTGAVANAEYSVGGTLLTSAETTWFVSAVGTRSLVQANSAPNISGMCLQLEKTAAEGGVEWLTAYKDLMQNDPETGHMEFFSQIRPFFKRWTGDPNADRLNFDVTRTWRWFIPYAQGGTGSAGTAAWTSTILLVTYHDITCNVAGTISGSAGGTVNLNLCRSATGERILSTSRVGNGAYSFTWFDQTENVFVEAYESGTRLGRSAPGLASVS